MVSKEPNHLLTGHTNSKSTLADKLPGTMTVRSVLLNRDSPDIESRLKRRRSRTHQVRFKDLEDGSSSSGNGGSTEAKSHRRPPTESDSPRHLCKHGIMASQGWTDREGPSKALPGQTSVVGAVRGDMAGTIEVVAAFLARAPPHPLTPGPTRRCWAPPQTNSLTLPMTRRPSTSTSTAIQTSPCLKKPQPLFSTNSRSHSLGDTVGADGDDEQDSQDEYLSHNHVSVPGCRDGTSPPGQQPVGDRRANGSRIGDKGVAVVKNSRYSCPMSVLNHTEAHPCSSVSCRDGSKRQGSTTPSLVRRRRRLNRAISDPGKEVSYCTTPTQTEVPSSSPPPTNTQLCTTQVQTESPCPSPPTDTKQCTIQSQTESPCPSPPLTETHSTTQVQTNNPCPSSPPLNGKQHTTQIQSESPCPSPSANQPCTTETQTDSSCASPLISTHIPCESPCVSPTLTQDITQTDTVPYFASPAQTLSPKPCAEPSCPSPTKPACTTVTQPTVPSTTIICSSSPPTVTESSISYYTVISPPTTPSDAADNFISSATAISCSTQNCITPVSNIVTCTTLSCSAATLTTAPSLMPNGPILAPTTTIAHPAPTNASNTIPAANVTACTFVTQTALSCTSISYYTTTHPIGPLGHHSNSALPPYATVIQTVSHCNIPCQAVQNISSASSGMAPYSSPVPKLKSCTSPPPLSTLANMQSSTTPTKTVPLYSSTFRAAPPYTPPSQAPYSTQDKRVVRLPPPPPPPPPYTPRKEGSITPGPALKPPTLRADSKASEKEQDREKEKREDVTGRESPKLCERASSLKYRASTPPVSVMKGEQQPSSPAKACSKPSCLSSAQAQLGALHKMLCSGASARPNTPNSQHPLPPRQQGCSGALGCSSSVERPASGPLTATQADTLRQVQEILGGLVSGAKCKLDPSRVTEKLLSPNGPLHDIRSLQTQLHSLEGVLETSQNTIKVLLDVIQDLEKKEAERDGRHSYRTGQDIENCGTCRDCACIIYSVEHDFRLQEGQVVRTWKVGDPPEGSPQSTTAQPTTPHRQESPQPVRPPATAKKNRKKCFWFL